MPLPELVAISNEFGRDPDYVLAGGGNTSYKDDRTLWVKSSGYALGTIGASGFAALDRAKLARMATRTYGTDPLQREEEVKRDLLDARVDPSSGLRPSVEASLHDVFQHPYVVHTHPHLVNALMCGRDGPQAVRRLFGDETLYVPYTDPGYVLYRRVAAELARWRSEGRPTPSIVFLENHGVFVGGDTPDAIRRLYAGLMEKLRAAVRPIPDPARKAAPRAAAEVLPALRMLLSGDGVKVGSFLWSDLAAHFAGSADRFAGVASAFTPDQIVYCKAHALYVDRAGTAAEVVATFQDELARFTAAHGYPPKIVVLRGLGVAAFEDGAASAEIALAVFEDAMKLSAYAESFGGPRFLSREAIAFIDSWEVENYRRALSKGAKGGSPLAQKIAIVTGGAQGFGAGLAEGLFADGANVIVADLNVERGEALVKALGASRTPGRNRARFVRCDVSDPASVEALVRDAVLTFGGLDLYVSNAGILRAGSLEEMTPETFELMTRVNYSAYFHGAKYASRVMKLQHAHRPGYLTDIVQINSKSGLEGSNKNFAYAGGKFGGIGLTQSFALELIEHGVKVNAICPGNFFDGPLWSDPQTGLFVQYLRAGKVPGARTVEDVKRHYESRVPARRGCTVLDVLRALRYVVEQEYETGQAVPVTGGQVMLR